MITTYEIRAIARSVWDHVAQSESPSENDLAFLHALNVADRVWHGNLRAAKINLGVKSEAYQAVKRLADRQQAAEYLAAYRTYDAAEEVELLQAAE